MSGTRSVYATSLIANYPTIFHFDDPLSHLVNDCHIVSRHDYGGTDPINPVE
jgi:hypothetical protein